MSTKLALVLGMHRSGTSAVMRFLTGLGAYVGEESELLEPQPDNPVGFLERTDVYEINESLLRKLDGSWSLPPQLDDRWHESHQFHEERRRAASIIADLAKAANSATVVIKDPRLSLLWPFWRDVRQPFSNVLVVRHPYDVGTSLLKRNGMSRSDAAYLWLIYNSAALSAKPKPLVVLIEHLMADPITQGTRLAEHLRLSTGQVEESVGEYLDQSMIHHRDSGVLPGDIGEAAGVVFEGLKELSTGRQMSQSAQQVVKIFGSQPWNRFVARRIEALESDSERLRNEMGGLRSAHSMSIKEVADREVKLAAVRLDLANSQATVEEVSAEVEELRSQSERRSRLAEHNLIKARSQRSAEVEELRSQSERRSRLAEHNLIKARSQREELERERSRIQQTLADRDDELHRITVRSAKLERRLHRLSNRRSIRVALRMARLAKPLFRVVRSFRSSVSSSKERSNGQSTHPLRQYKDFDSRLDSRTRRRLTRHYLRSKQLSSATVSVVMPTYDRAGTLRRAVDSVLSQSHANLELLVVDDGSTDGTAQLLDSINDPRLRVVRTVNQGVSAARNAGLDNSTGDFVFYLDSDNQWDQDFVRLMIAGIDARSVDFGYAALRVVGRNQEVLFHRGADFDWDWCREANYVDLNVFGHRREAIKNLRFDTTLRRMVDWDFILRVTRSSDVAYFPFVGCLYSADNEPARITNQEPAIWGKIVRSRHEGGVLVEWSDVAENLSISIAIKTAAPEDRKEAWGDYHFASSLAASLERLGHEVRVDHVGDWYDKGPIDVNLVLRGLTEFVPEQGAMNVIWSISHPDTLSPTELPGFDIVYSASESYAALLKQQVGPGSVVKPLLQATDSSRFLLSRRGEGSPYQSKVLFVGNSRNEFRDIVRWAHEAGVDLATFGQGWRQFIGDAAHDELIDNEDLGAAYAASGVVLNDHWPSMRDFGYVSNRVFDVVATGTRLITDRVPALDRLFGDAVSQVTSSDELVEAIESDGPDQETLFDLARSVADNHTFDDRAKTLNDDILSWLNLPFSRASSEVPRAQRADRSSPAITLRPRVSVGYMVTQGSGGPQSSAFVRLIGPLTTQAAVDAVELERVPLGGSIEGFDVLIIQRATLPDTDEVDSLLAQIDARGGPRLIVDVDDAFNLIGHEHPDYEMYVKQNEAVERLLSASDEQWFSTEQLMHAYGYVDMRRPGVVPNSLDPRFWRRYWRTGDPSDSPNPIPRLLYMGTRTHDDDFAVVFPALDALSRSFAFELTLVGAVQGQLPTRDWLHRLSVPARCGVYPAFARWLSAQGRFDLGISPLRDSPFNRCKSDIKFLDYSALAVPAMLSAIEPYTGEVRERGLALFATADEWERQLAEFLSSPSSFSDLGTRANEYLWSERSSEKTGLLMVEKLRGLADE